MDDKEKEEWKWKFYRLVLLLNALVLSCAITVIVILKAPEPYRIPAAVMLVIITAALAITFIKRYHTTKAWLEERADGNESE